MTYSGLKVSTITASSSVASLPMDASTVPGCGPCGMPAGWTVNDEMSTPRRLMKLPAPYNHSNINSDEVIYYVAGNFMSRRGVDISSFTLHPAGIPHGPHPGTVEASIGKEATEELAVMVDTFHPLLLTKQAAGMEDDRYPYSWLPPEDASAEADELARRGPEAFPD